MDRGAERFFADLLTVTERLGSAAKDLPAALVSIQRELGDGHDGGRQKLTNAEVGARVPYGGDRT